ncbi:MAG: FlgO family outer membrane protein [Methylobacter sp.]|nr:FlgO family outer membrane protein [Methylobacter sp.]
MLKKATIFISALLIATLNGCASYRYYEVKDADLVEVSYDATCELKDRLTRTLPKNSLIIVSTLLNVDDLSKTSSFGRIISDQIASAFHNSGYQIIGMEMPIDLFVMKEKGALHLSDEAKAELKPYRPAVIVGGVYAPGKKNTYVSLRIVDLHTKNIISSTDFSVPMGPDAKFLLETKEVGSAGARSEPSLEGPGATPAVEETVPPVETETPPENVK